MHQVTATDNGQGFWFLELGNFQAGHNLSQKKWNFQCILFPLTYGTGDLKFIMKDIKSN